MSETPPPPKKNHTLQFLTPWTLKTLGACHTLAPHSDRSPLKTSKETCADRGNQKNVRQLETNSEKIMWHKTNKYYGIPGSHEKCVTQTTVDELMECGGTEERAMIQTIVGRWRSYIRFRVTSTLKWWLQSLLLLLILFVSTFEYLFKHCCLRGGGALS